MIHVESRSSSLEHWTSTPNPLGEPERPPHSRPGFVGKIRNPRKLHPQEFADLLEMPEEQPRRPAREPAAQVLDPAEEKANKAALLAEGVKMLRLNATLFDAALKLAFPHFSRELLDCLELIALRHKNARTFEIAAACQVQFWTAMLYLAERPLLDRLIRANLARSFWSYETLWEKAQSRQLRRDFLLRLVDFFREGKIQAALEEMQSALNKDASLLGAQPVFSV